MNDEPKKAVPSQESLEEAMRRAASNPNIMGQAAKMMNMGYAFAFSRMAKPKAEIIPLSDVGKFLSELHEKQALIVSASCFQNPNTKRLDVLVTYYKTEG